MRPLGIRGSIISTIIALEILSIREGLASECGFMYSGQCRRYRWCTVAALNCRVSRMWPMSKHAPFWLWEMHHCTAAPSCGFWGHWPSEVAQEKKTEFRSHSGNCTTGGKLVTSSGFTIETGEEFPHTRTINTLYFQPFLIAIRIVQGGGHSREDDKFQNQLFHSAVNHIFSMSKWRSRNRGWRNPSWEVRNNDCFQSCTFSPGRTRRVENKD